MIPRYVVITTYERPDMCLDAINTCHDADVVLVVDNGTNKPMPEPGDEKTLTPYYLLRDDQQPVNLSALWNEGLAWCEEDAKQTGATEWDVAIINDDVLLPEYWLTNVQGEMRRTPAVAACTGPTTILHTQPGPVPLHLRMTGWAFMLRGETGLRVDETFQWWFGDSDLDWNARQNGGMLMFSGPVPENRCANGYTTGERAAQAGRDHAAFLAKWGMTAW